jgi:hypothetical protein
MGKQPLTGRARDGAIGNKKARKPFGCGLKLPGSGASLKNRFHIIA